MRHGALFASLLVLAGCEADDQVYAVDIVAQATVVRFGTTEPVQGAEVRFDFTRSDGGEPFTLFRTSDELGRGAAQAGYNLRAGQRACVEVGVAGFGAKTDTLTWDEVHASLDFDTSVPYRWTPTFTLEVDTTLLP